MRSILRNAFRDLPPNRQVRGRYLGKEEGKCEAFLGMPSGTCRRTDR